MREWVWHTEHILALGEAKGEEDGKEKPGNQTIGQLFDEWCNQLEKQAQSGTLSKNEQACLEHFLRISHHLRPHLIQCYSEEGLPRTNNEMEGYIRALKTRYRRISGRKNWNNYLLRYGRSTAYYQWWEEQVPDEVSQLQILSKVGRENWRAARHNDWAQREEWLLRYRFRHNPSKYLHRLEERWVATLTCT